MGASGGRAFRSVGSNHIDGQALSDSSGQPIVHFGYVDGISQPRFQGLHDPADYSDKLPLAPLGVVLLGHPSALPHVVWAVPQPDVLGRSGTFCAFWLLEQDVRAFEDYLTAVAAAQSCPRELGRPSCVVVGATVLLPARGPLANFVCASLAAQFEAVQYDWLNLGCQDPRISGTNDPLTGANEATTSSYLWPREGRDPIVLRHLPRFVVTRGGAYIFLPSIPAIRWISCVG